MGLIPTLISFSAGTLIKSADANSNNTNIRDAFNNTVVLTDVARTIAVAHTFAADILFTDALYDIGKSGATRPRDGFFSRNLTVGGTAAVSGAVTLSSTLDVAGIANIGGATNGLSIGSVAGKNRLQWNVNAFEFVSSANVLTNISAAAATLSSTLAVTGTATIGGGTGQALSSGSLDVAKDIGMLATYGFIVGSTRIMVFGSLGQVLVGTTVTTGAAAGEVVLANAKALRGVNAAGADTYPLIVLNASNFVQVGTTTHTNPIKISYDTNANLLAGGANANGVLGVDSTNNRLCYWSGGARYYLLGTAF